MTLDDVTEASIDEMVHQAVDLSLQEGISGVGGPGPEATDDDLDLWWGSVEIDRLASGLTLATISVLTKPDSDGGPAGPWLQRSDATGDDTTQLTPQGREATRQLSTAVDAS